MDWLSACFAETGFIPAARAIVAQAFGMGTSAWALRADVDMRKARIRCYDAHMPVSLT